MFAREGAKVVIAARTEARGEEAAAAIREEGGQAFFIRTDVSIASEVARLVKLTKDKLGKIDILMNSAGQNMKRVPVETIEESLWDVVYAVDVKGIFLTAKYVVPEMKRIGHGTIINMGSMAGVRPNPYAAAYSSAKGAVDILTKALALELASSNIRVNCIHPGPVDTPLWGRVAASFDVGTIPLGRLTRPEDVAYAALYLASDESAMVTGLGLTVDGGRNIGLKMARPLDGKGDI